MSGSSRLLIAIIAILLFGAYEAYAGLIIERERYEEGKGQKSKATIYIQKNKVKSFDQNGQFSAIFNLDTDEIIQVDNISRTYSSTKSKDYFLYYKKYALKMKGDMMQQLSELPPDQRVQAEIRMKEQGIDLPGLSSGPLKITLEKTGDRNKIAGYESVKYELYRNGNLDEEIWTSSDVRFQEEIDMKKMANYLGELRKVEDTLGGTSSLSGESDKAYMEVFSSGFPMKTVDHNASGNSIIEETVKVSKKSLDNSEFDAPAGYRKVQLDQMLQLGSQ